MSVISPDRARLHAGTAVADPSVGGRLRRRAQAWARTLFASDRGEGDQARVQRIGARFLGAGLIGYLLVSLGTIGQAAPLTVAWWPPLSVVLALSLIHI